MGFTDPTSWSCWLVMSFGFVVLYIVKVNKEAAYRALEVFCKKNNFFFQAQPDRSINYKISGKSGGNSWSIENFTDLHRNHITKKDESLLRFICNGVYVDNGFGVMDMLYKDVEAQGDAKNYVKNNMEILFHGELDREFDEMEISLYGHKEFTEKYVTFLKENSEIEKIIDTEVQRFLMAFYSKKNKSGYFGILMTKKGFIIKAPGSNDEKEIMNMVMLSEKILKKIH
jgi:hypothetical protein